MRASIVNECVCARAPQLVLHWKKCGKMQKRTLNFFLNFTHSDELTLTLHFSYAKPKPSAPSRTASVNFSFNNCSVEYSGKSNWLKHVCAVGKSSSDADAR